MVKRRRSRLTRKQEARSFRQAIFFGLLTFAIALALVFLGIPIMIRFAIFLGDLHSSSQPVENKDTVPPAPVRFQAPLEATNQPQIEIEGFAEAGATVEIFVSGSSQKKVIAENNGTFKASGILLSEGSNKIYALATDETGNTSQISKIIAVLFDQSPPELEISEPGEDSEISGDDGRITIKGKTEPKVKLAVNERVVIVNAEGAFEHPLVLSEGENTIKITATDKAGNQAEKEIKVNYSP